MKFRRTLRRDEVMRRLEVALWSPSPEGTVVMVDPAEASRAGPLSAQDEQIGREASPEGARQLPLF